MNKKIEMIEGLEGKVGVDLKVDGKLLVVEMMHLITSGSITNKILLTWVPTVTLRMKRMMMSRLSNVHAAWLSELHAYFVVCCLRMLARIVDVTLGLCTAHLCFYFKSM